MTAADADWRVALDPMALSLTITARVLHCQTTWRQDRTSKLRSNEERSRKPNIIAGLTDSSPQWLQAPCRDGLTPTHWSERYLTMDGSTVGIRPTMAILIRHGAGDFRHMVMSHSLGPQRYRV